jgi:hypothetical protein
MNDGNRLLNGNWEEGFYLFREEVDLEVPRGWFPWWLLPNKGSPEWSNHRPLFDSFPIAGRQVQRIRSPNATFVGGLLQQAKASPGQRYSLTAECQAWSSDTTIAGNLVNPGEVNVHVGIDPTGGTEPESSHVFWSTSRQRLGEWQTTTVEAEAQGPVITVYLRSAPAEPKLQQAIFWRDVRLTGEDDPQSLERFTGLDETMITFEPPSPNPGQRVVATVSSAKNHVYCDLWLLADGLKLPLTYKGKDQLKDRHVWRYEFDTTSEDVLEARFVGDEGARLLALETLVVSNATVEVPVAVEQTEQPAHPDYRRVYILLPPAADRSWFVAAARGSFHGRYTIGFSADDAGIGDFKPRYILAVNPHHWPTALTDDWFDQTYPGATFVAIVCAKPADLEQWLRNWTPNKRRSG